MGVFDQQTIGVACPACGHTTHKMLAWIKVHSDFACPGCRKIIHLERDTRVRGIRRADKAVADLHRKLREFGNR